MALRRSFSGRSFSGRSFSGRSVLGRSVPSGRPAENTFDILITPAAV